MPTRRWGATRRAWRGRQAFRFPGQQQAFDDYLFAVDRVERRIEMLQAELHRRAGEGPHRELIARLRCMRGIDTPTAVRLVAEAGDFTRFRSAEFMSFVGLIPSERSSGQTRRQGSITKAGSAHTGRLLVESAGNGRLRPTVGYELSRRQRGQDPQVLERAWRCQPRLHRRWSRMAGRGKPHQKIIVAYARELAGFVCAIATISRCGLTEKRSCLSVGWRALPSQKENPRFNYAADPSATRDARKRQLRHAHQLPKRHKPRQTNLTADHARRSVGAHAPRRSTIPARPRLRAPVASRPVHFVAFSECVKAPGSRF